LLPSADADGFYRTTHKIGGRSSRALFHSLAVYAAEPRGEVRHASQPKPRRSLLTDASGGA